MVEISMITADLSEKNKSHRSDNHWQVAYIENYHNIEDRHYRPLVFGKVDRWLPKVVGQLVCLNLLLMMSNYSDNFKVSHEMTRRQNSKIEMK